jgi:hypothetical protein
MLKIEAQAQSKMAKENAETSQLITNQARCGIPKTEDPRSIEDKS